MQICSMMATALSTQNKGANIKVFTCAKKKTKGVTFETYFYSFSWILSISMPQKHGSFSELWLSEDSRLDSSLKKLSLSGAKMKMRALLAECLCATDANF